MGECRLPNSPHNVTFAKSADPPPDWLPLLAALPVILLLLLAAACTAFLLRSAALFRRPGYYQQNKPGAEAGSALVPQPRGVKPAPLSGSGREEQAAGAAVTAARQPLATVEHHTAVQVAVAADEPAGPLAAADGHLAGLQLDGSRLAVGAKGQLQQGQQALLFERLYCAVPVSAHGLPGPAAAASGTSKSASDDQQQEGSSTPASSSSSGALQEAAGPLAGAADPEAAAAFAACRMPQPCPVASPTHPAAPGRHPSSSCFPASGPYLGPDCALYEPPRHRVILNRVSGHCPVGQVLGVLGPSGSGKTTLLSLVAAAGGGADISDRAHTGGCIALAGSASASERRALTSHVHQDDLLLPRSVVGAALRRVVHGSVGLFN
jgi:ABC-type multidrug transport system fused ATPase/permease subunit